MCQALDRADDVATDLILTPGNSLAVQGLGLSDFTAGGLGSTPGWGTKIPQASWCVQKRKVKKKNFPTVCSRDFHYPHFIGADTEDARTEVVCPRSHRYWGTVDTHSI